jgi:histidinol-phosphate aminotransferase
MHPCDFAPGYVKQIAPYQPGKPTSELARELGLDEKAIVKLASNENPLGPSPRALAAIQTLLSGLAQYPDGSGHELKSVLMDKYAVQRDQVFLGNGSNDVLELAARVFLTPHSSAIYSQHAFAVYPLVVQAIGAKGIEVPALAFGHDLDAMRAAVREDTRVVFIANPNNPTGTFVDERALLGLLAALPPSVLVVLDEAYVEYLPPDLRMPSHTWIKRFPNLVVTRTLSKAYGLAGLRVGFALADARVADLMNRVRQPFNVNSLALAAAAAALGDDAFLHASFDLNRRGMQQLTQGFKRLGLPYIHSVGNFVSVRVGRAESMFQFLLRQGVIVRPIGGYGLPEHLRITVGLESENEKFLQVLERGMRELGSA